MDYPDIKFSNITVPQFKNGRISQHRLFTKTTFELEEERLKYTLKTSNSTQSFFIPYANIDFKTATDFIEKNSWFRNVGALWVIIGLAMIFMNSLSGGFFWLTMGVLCLAFYFLASTSYTHIPCHDCNILVIKNKNHDEVINMIKTYQKNFLRRHAGIYADETYHSSSTRLKWLLNMNAITQEEYNESNLLIQNQADNSQNDDIIKSDADEKRQLN